MMVSSFHVIFRDRKQKRSRPLLLFVQGQKRKLLRCHPAWRGLRPLSALHQVPAFDNGMPFRLPYWISRSVRPPGSIRQVCSSPRSHRPRLAWEVRVLCTIPSLWFLESIPQGGGLVKRGGTKVFYGKIIDKKRKICHHVII